MKAIEKFHLLSVLFLPFFLFTGCQDQGDDLIITNTSLVNLSETSVTLNWSTNLDVYSAAEVSISAESETSASPIVKTVNNNSEKSVEINGLTGITQYHYRLSLLRDGTIITTTEGNFKTLYTVEPLEAVTRDSIQLAGKISYLIGREEKVPGIIMMHGWKEMNNGWEGSEILEKLLLEGYACMTFCFRGHGTSGNFDLDKFFTPDGTDFSPEAMIYCLSDVEAALHGIMQHPAVDSTYIGLAGSSMGAGVAYYATMFPEIHTSVGLSTTLITEYKDYKVAFPEMAPFERRSMYFIAASEDIIENERGVHDYEMMAKQAFAETQPPKGLWIIQDSQSHGFSLLDETGVMDSVVVWFVEQMPSLYSD